MFLNMSFIIYTFLILIILGGIFYVLRRIHGIKNYSKILEKKLIMLKKENKELQELLEENKNTTLQDADIIMNKIFNLKNTENINTASCQLNNIPSNINILEVNNQELSDNIVSNIISETFDFPSDEHDTKIQKLELNENEKDKDKYKDNEIESIISDGSCNIYNKKKLTKMNLDKLKELCLSLNIPSDGTKNNIIDRILTKMQ